MKMKVFNREDVETAINILGEPRFVFRGIRTRATHVGPEVALYVQITDGEKVVEYEEVIHSGPGELKEEEYQKKVEEFNDWIFKIKGVNYFLEGVVE